MGQGRWPLEASQSLTSAKVVAPAKSTPLNGSGSPTAHHHRRNAFCASSRNWSSRPDIVRRTVVWCWSPVCAEVGVRRCCGCRRARCVPAEAQAARRRQIQPRAQRQSIMELSTARAATRGFCVSVERKRSPHDLRSLSEITRNIASCRLAPLFERHRQRVGDRGRDRLRIVGVDQQRRLSSRRRAGEAREDQHARDRPRPARRHIPWPRGSCRRAAA